MHRHEKKPPAAPKAPHPATPTKGPSRNYANSRATADQPRNGRHEGQASQATGAGGVAERLRPLGPWASVVHGDKGSRHVDHAAQRHWRKEAVGGA